MLHYNDALYNLLSIKSFMNDNLYTIDFDNDNFVIKDKKLKRVIFKGKANRVLYLIAL
jgi:hypothetical protein